jgi:asparagine synthase (glutamine-hydrolysing)
MPPSSPTAPTPPAPLTPLEVASSYLPGDVEAAPLADAEPFDSPRAALEAVLLEALQTQPCAVSFSGGRDSSAVLAVAVDVARRHGLPPPLPVTYRWSHAPESDESEWQEIVIRHLGLSEWEVIDGSPYLDSVGETSARVLLRHDLLFPPGVYLQVPVFERVAAATLVGGLGGDQLLGEWRWQRAADVLARRERAGRQGILALGHWAAPGPVRRRVAERRRGPGLPWLRPAAREQLTSTVRAERLSEPRTWRRRVEWLGRRRALAHMRYSTGLMAADHGAVAVSPFLDPRFLQALARTAPRWGLGDRRAAMYALFGDVLPRATLERRTKAGTSRAYAGERTREFVASWDGTGVDHDLVDAAELRRAWDVNVAANGRAELQLQAAWLLTRRSGRG